MSRRVRRPRAGLRRPVWRAGVRGSRRDDGRKPAWRRCASARRTRPTAQPAVLAARAGVHVLVEKPMAACLADCDAMIAAAREGNVKLAVISQRRFYEPVVRLKAAIDAGKIGTPVLGDSAHAELARRGVLPLRPVARALGHGRRRRAGEPGAPPPGPDALVHGTHPADHRRLRQPEPSLYRGGGHGAGDGPLPQRRPWVPSSPA